MFLFFIISSCENNKVDNLRVQIHSGDKIVAFIYEDAGKQGLIDTNNNIILKAQFDYIQHWQECGLIVVDSGGKLINGGDYIDYKFCKYGLIDLKGRVLFRPQFDKIIISDNSALVRKDSLYGFINDQGNWLIKPKYKYAAPFDNGAAIVKINNHQFLINKKDEIISHISFDTIWGFKNTISVVSQNGKWGYINTSGQLILPLDHYTGIGDFHSFYGKFMQNGKWQIIDKTGRTFQQPFDEVEIINSNDTIYAEGINNNQKIRIKLN
jgi:hypothetical protein